MTVRVIDTESTDDVRSIAGASGLQYGGGEPAERRRSWRLWRRLGPDADKRGGSNDDFMAVFSHELRNSLGAIRNAAGILGMEQSPTATALKARLLIERQVGHMTRLVEDLLDVSRIRSGHLRLQRERVDLGVILSHCAQVVEPVMQQRRHRLSLWLPEAPMWLWADATRLQQVFVNLLVNAAKYTDTGGEVQLLVEWHVGEAVVRVRDTGIGIASDILPKVFDLFVQADSSSRDADTGLGIGLALVRGLVESHGGRISAASAGLGQGSEFAVRLPLWAS